MDNITAVSPDVMVFLEEEIFYIVTIVIVVIAIIWLLIRG